MDRQEEQQAVGTFAGYLAKVTLPTIPVCWLKLNIDTGKHRERGMLKQAVKDRCKMCCGEWETQCANPIWSYQDPEFHSSGYSTCIFIVPKCSLKLFSDFSQLFNLLPDHSALAKSLDSFLGLYRKQRAGPYLSVTRVSCLIDYRKGARSFYHIYIVPKYKCVHH